MPERKDWSKASIAISAGRPPREPGQPLSVPPYLTTSYLAGATHSYARDDGTPTWEAFEDVLGALEGGSAVAFSSGMAAVAAVFNGAAFTSLVVPKTCYAGVRPMARDYAAARNVALELVDITDTAATLAPVTPGALLWLESPTNPLLEVADLPALIEGAKARGATVAVDNTFATPLLQLPLALGADFSVHSVSKYIAGHADATMGATIVSDPEKLAALRYQREYNGTIPGAMETFLAVRGIRTLPLRFEKAQANARELAPKIAAHSAVEVMRYPGFGGMIAFDVRGGADAANRVCNATRLIMHATSLGGVETTMERRQKYAGDSYVPEGLIRLSVGCEDPADLWSDLQSALG